MEAVLAKRGWSFARRKWRQHERCRLRWRVTVVQEDSDDGLATKRVHDYEVGAVQGCTREQRKKELQVSGGRPWVVGSSRAPRCTVKGPQSRQRL